MSEERGKGIVGFFDILGYGNFLENNNENTEPVIEKIIKIKSLKSEMTDFFSTRTKMTNETHAALMKKIEDLQWLYLSDSIIIHAKFGNENPTQMFNQMAALCAACIFLMRKMFEFGFPLRGAIEIGDYYFNDNMFAGMPIVNSYKLMQELDIAACVFGETAKEFILEKKIETFSPLILKYPVPIKSKRLENKLTLNYLAIKSKQFPPITIDFRQYVLESFSRHNKTIDSSVESKICNTEYYFHFIKDKFPRLFEPFEQDKK